MKQSDTPRTDAAEQFVSYFGWQVHADFVRDLERELAAVTRERDEARAEVERLRAELFSVLRGDGIDHLYDGDCPVRNALHARDPACPACKRLNELAATEPKP